MSQSVVQCVLFIAAAVVVSSENNCDEESRQIVVLFHKSSKYKLKIKDACTEYWQSELLLESLSATAKLTSMFEK